MIDFATLQGLSIPEGVVTKIVSNGEMLWEKVKPLVNWARKSINADGTIYNDGLGYKNGYRVRSGGAETAGTDFVCTGFIPLKKGDTLRIYPPFSGSNTGNAINFSDENFTNLGQITDNGNTCYGICVGKYSDYKTQVINSVSTLTLDDRHDSTIAYARVTHKSYDTKKGELFIVTVNQEIPL